MSANTNAQHLSIAVPLTLSFDSNLSCFTQPVENGVASTSGSGGASVSPSVRSRAVAATPKADNVRRDAVRGGMSIGVVGGNS